MRMRRSRSKKMNNRLKNKNRKKKKKKKQNKRISIPHRRQPKKKGLRLSLPLGNATFQTSLSPGSRPPYGRKFRNGLPACTSRRCTKQLWPRRLKAVRCKVNPGFPLIFLWRTRPTTRRCWMGGWPGKTSSKTGRPQIRPHQQWPWPKPNGWTICWPQEHYENDPNTTRDTNRCG